MVGFDRGLEFPRKQTAVAHKAYTLPIYDHKYIQAVPIETNHSENSSIKFSIYVSSNVNEVKDDYMTKVAVSISITFGGLALIALTIAAVLMWKWLKKREEHKKGKINIKSI